MLIRLYVNCNLQTFYLTILIVYSIINTSNEGVTSMTNIIGTIIVILVFGEFLFGCFVYVWHTIASYNYFKEWEKRIARSEYGNRPEFPRFPHFK